MGVPLALDEWIERARVAAMVLGTSVRPGYASGDLESFRACRKRLLPCGSLRGGCGSEWEIIREESWLF